MSAGLHTDQEVSAHRLSALLLSRCSKPCPCLEPEITGAERVKQIMGDSRGKEAGEEARPELLQEQSHHLKAYLSELSAGFCLQTVGGG